jgi:hypoxanthine phosphoribosyltransferase
LNNDIEKVMFSEETLAARVAELGQQISSDFEGKRPLLVGILKGCFMFMADLMRHITIPCTTDFMAVSSYGNKSVTTGAVKINKDLSEDIEGRDVIIVEDILDSGITLSYLMNYMEVRKPASISIVTLFDKPARRQKEVSPRYKGFEIEDEFIVGYGLDYAEEYRNLPYIGVLKPEIYTD